MSTLIIVGLALLVVPGLLVLVADRLFAGRESYTISTRELRNTAVFDPAIYGADYAATYNHCRKAITDAIDAAERLDR